MRYMSGRGIAGLLICSVASLAIAAASGGDAFARGGTAKPPGGNSGGGGGGGGGGGTTVATPQVTILPPAGPVLGLPGSSANGFDVNGFVQSVTVDGGCDTTNLTAGGTVKVNNILVTVPTDTIVQFPANTTTWKDAVCGFPGVQAALGLDGTGASATGAIIFPSVEISVVGNIVSVAGVPTAATGKYIAALISTSQHSLHAGSGYIDHIDYTDGSIWVGDGQGGFHQLIINDPEGRFGRPNTSTDARFSVDSENPTIKTAETGYPMCVPRDKDASGAALGTVNVPGIGSVPNDPRCPPHNRPISAGGTTCRNFASAGGVQVPVGGDIVTTPANQPCRAFVMQAVRGMPGTSRLASSQLRGNSDPDPREQVPFLPGDFITWGGTYVPTANTANPADKSTGIIWAHTIDANLGIYTQPATLPAYVAIGEFGIGVEPNPNPAIAGVETTDRIFLEAGTTDIASIIDIYLDDKGFALPAGSTTGPLVPQAGSEYFRWVTMESMTGALTEQVGGRVQFATTVLPFGGGIETQYVGPVPGRARIRANKVPAINPALPCPPEAGTQGCAVTQSPTRYLRVVIRSLCAPAASDTVDVNGVTVPRTNLDGGAWFDINGTRTQFGQTGTGSVQCLESANFANGLSSGQYMAPVGEFIFGEPTLAGSPILPNNIWQLGFLLYGEGGAPGSGDSTAPQSPQPW